VILVWLSWCGNLRPRRFLQPCVSTESCVRTILLGCYHGYVVVGQYAYVRICLGVLTEEMSVQMTEDENTIPSLMDDENEGLG